MSDEIRITVLVENSVNTRGLQAEHGLALHIQTGRNQLLFDTGQSDLLIQNARKLQLDLKGLDAVVLSHGHYDHTGGLKVVREMAPQTRFYLHPAALLPKFAGQPDGTSRAIGMNEENVKAVCAAAQSVVWTYGPTEVVDGIFVTGEIPRQNNFEDTGGRFFLDDACTRPDPLVDDQALFFDTCEGLVVVLGCGHAGVVNTLEHIRRITGDRPVHAIIGGLHLGSASEERIQQTISRLRAANLDCLAPVHCTGWPATARLWQAFPNICRPVGVGTVFEFKRD